MYKLRLVSTDEEIIQFERLRTEVFSKGRKTINTLYESPFADAIKDGDMLAFLCMEEKRPIGGMLIRQQGKDIKLSRIFVQKEKQGQGAGSFMLKYLDDHKNFFEDYYATDIYGIITEPLNTSVDYYFNKGYDYSGYQMYKQYKKSNK